MIIMNKLEIYYDQKFKPQQRLGECDCACADISRSYLYNVGCDEEVSLDTNTLLIKNENITMVPLDGQHFVFIEPSKNGRIGVLNSLTLDLVNSFSTPARLEEVFTKYPLLEKSKIVTAIRFLCKLNILNSGCNHNNPVSEIFPQKTLTAWIHVTNSCNFQCPYCFVKKSDEEMSFDVGLKSIQNTIQLAKKNNFQEVKIKYAGGEPTLNFTLIKYLNNIAMEEANKNQLLLKSVILTNGTILNDRIIDFLSEYGISIMISLDGIGFYHNIQRSYKNGKGSFEKVTGNIEKLLNKGITPFISITLTNENIDGLDQTVEFLLDRDLPFALNFIREIDAQISVNSLDPLRIINRLRSVYQIIEKRLPNRSFTASLLDLTNLSFSHLKTCGIGQSYVVFDHKGRYTDCHMNMKNLNELQASDTCIFSSKLDSHLDVNLNGEGCAICKWRYWCAGGCPLIPNRVNDTQEIYPYYCEVYRTLLPEVLKLEGFRLLKYYNNILL